MRPFLAIFLATLWISLSEFLRNEFLLREDWIDHYSSLGLVFPAEPVNGVVWGVWSLVFAIAIYIISRKFNLVQTAALAWLVGFVLMWLVIGNMNVLPFSILYMAIPLSLLEVFGAAYLIDRLAGTKQ